MVKSILHGQLTSQQLIYHASWRFTLNIAAKNNLTISKYRLSSRHADEICI
jgi:hypothetical protein